jgi:hypothetical protein
MKLFGYELKKVVKEPKKEIVLEKTNVMTYKVEDGLKALKDKRIGVK